MSVFQPISSSAASNIAHLALNKDPVVANPFALQLALVANNRHILVCESKVDNLVIQQEIRAEDNVVALSYNKYCICYALPNAYFVHNILEHKTLSLFPYDSQTIRPLIINTDAVSKFFLELTKIEPQRKSISKLQILAILGRISGKWYARSRRFCNIRGRFITTAAILGSDFYRIICVSFTTCLCSNSIINYRLQVLFVGIELLKVSLNRSLKFI